MSGLKGILFDFGDTLVVENTDLTIPILECDLSLVPHAAEVIPALSMRYTLAVVSNTHTSGDAQLSEALRKVGLLDHFSTVVTSVTAGAAKPDPRIYLEALERIALQPDEVAMVGDRIDTDILGANRLGIKSVLHRWNDRYPLLVPSPAHRPSVSISSLRNLESNLS